MWKIYLLIVWEIVALQLALTESEFPTFDSFNPSFSLPLHQPPSSFKFETLSTPPATSYGIPILSEFDFPEEPVEYDIEKLLETAKYYAPPTRPPKYAPPVKPAVQYAPPATHYTVPPKPSAQYAPPSRPPKLYAPQRPTTPRPRPTTFPPRPAIEYAPPPKPATEYALPPKPAIEYALPPKPAIEYAPPPKPAIEYALPPKPAIEYAPPPKPAIYYAPPRPLTEYAPPRPSTEYAPPRKVVIPALRLYVNVHPSSIIAYEEPKSLYKIPNIKYGEPEFLL